MFQHRQQWKKKIAGLNGSVNAIGVAKEIENNEYMMYSLCVVVVKTLHRALHITCCIFLKYFNRLLGRHHTLPPAETMI